MPWVAGLNLPRVPEEAADGTEMREHWFCPKGYVHQLVHQPIRTMANNRNDSEERICLFAVKSEQPQTAANLLSLPYKEGSLIQLQHRPLINYLQIAVRRRRLGGGALGGQGRSGHDAPAGDRACATGRTLGKPTLPQFLESEPTGKTSAYKRTRQYRTSEAEVPTQGGLALAGEEGRDRSTPIEDLYSEYTVYDMHYEKVGKIDDIFVDENDNPEYLGVKMGFLGTRSTLIPVDIVRVNDRRRLVEVAADKETVKNGPTFSDDREITPEFERQVLNYYQVESRQASSNREGYGAYYPESTGDERVGLRPGERVGNTRAGSERAGAATGDTRSDTMGAVDHELPASPRRQGAAERVGDRVTDEDEIRVQRSEEELVAGTREREAGSVKVRKRVRTDRERLSVPKKREEVSVERVPVEEDRREAEGRGGALESGIVEEDGEIRIPIIEEEIVVEKRPVVKEEIQLRKNVVEEEEVVEEDVRKEEVDVEDRTTRRDLSGHSSPEDHKTIGRSPKEARDETRLEESDKADRQEETSKKDQQRATNTNATKENQQSVPVADYDDLTVEEAKERLDGLSEGELRKVRSHEKKHKNRNTLLTWLDRKIKKVSGGGQESERA